MLLTRPCTRGCISNWTRLRSLAKLESITRASNYHSAQSASIRNGTQATQSFYTQQRRSYSDNIPRERQKELGKPNTFNKVSDTSTTPKMYTASTAFFEALHAAGVQYCFVNLGSDHPSLLEAIARGRKNPSTFPKIITCPNEMVALSMADGYARASGRPQCVIVHVDVGTQGLGAAVHNADKGRAPVLIFAGLSPVTIEGEYRGSRTEYIHWIQDVNKQEEIVGQYCRYTGEIKQGRNVKQMVNRALTWAMSEPRGPVYLYGAREVMEEDIEPYELIQEFWRPVEPAALPQKGVEMIAKALVEAEEPLIVTGYSGRNHEAPGELVKLADAIKGLRVLDTGGSDMCFPADHPAWLGLRYGSDESIRTADAILVLDCDVPWINTQCHPKKGAKIFHVDVDPLKQQMPTFYLDALARYKADSLTSITQIREYIEGNSTLKDAISQKSQQQGEQRQKEYKQRMQGITDLAQPSTTDDHFNAAYLGSRLKALCPENTTWVAEAVTSTVFIADQIQATRPGSWINCGGGGLGWSGGAALGIKLAGADNASGGAKTRGERDNNHGAFIAQIVGDGTFLFSVPASVHWIAQRYSIPVLTIVLNNEGWRAPKRSLLLVHPDGEASKATGEELGISFNPSPDYAGIAKAAAGHNLYAGRAATRDELERVLKEAIESVQNGTGAVLDCHLDGSSGKYVEKSKAEGLM